MTSGWSTPHYPHSMSSQDFSFDCERPDQTLLSELTAVLSLLSKERGVYGLRNGDYDKYRRHCSNKIHRLRVVTGSTCGKHKVYKKPGPINKETVKDIK